MDEGGGADENRERIYERGRVTWHTSDEEGGGPDVGISVGLGDGRMLYAGDMPGLDNFGWDLTIYATSKPGTIKLAAAIDAELAREAIEFLGRALSGGAVGRSATNAD